MKTTKTTLFTWALMSFASLAVARGFGDRSDGASRDARADPRSGASGGEVAAPARSYTQPSAAPTRSYTQPSAAPTRSYTQPSAAPTRSPTPRYAPVTTYTPAAQPASGAYSGGATRETPAPQARTYTAPRGAADTGASPVPTRAAEAPRTTVARETPTREPRTTSGFSGATYYRDPTPGSSQKPAAPRVVNDDSARSSGTARTFRDPQENPAVTPAAPAVTRRTPDSRTPDSRTPDRPRVTATKPAVPAQSPVSDKPEANRMPSGPSYTRSTDQPATVTSPTRDRSDRTAGFGTRTRDADGQPARDRTDRTAGFGSRTRDDSASRANTASRPTAPRLTAPETRFASPVNRTHGESNLRFGSAGDNARSRSGLPLSGTSLRSTRPGGDDDRGTRDGFTSPRSSRFSSGRDPGGSDRRPSSGSSRYSDGRSTLYHAPDRYAAMGRHTDYRAGSDYRGSRESSYYHGSHERSDYHGGHGGHHSDYHYYPYSTRYYHNAFSPVWCGPAVYPAGNYFGFGWNNGSWGLSVGFSTTPYYDSWSCGGWGYSGVYYGGWRDNWYGGFSYVYNPWPVYRSYYLYEPVPLVTGVETVYVTQPATTTYVVQSPAPTTYVEQSPAPAAPVQQAAAVVTEEPPPQPNREAAPAAERAETVASPCFCPCHCNGQRPCTCDYPCGSEYAVSDEQFDLSNAYSSYAVTLSPETIWSSYAGLDRWDSAPEPTLHEATVSTDNDQP